MEASKVDQWLKTLAVKSDDLSLIPGTDMVEREIQLLQVVLWHPCAHHSMSAVLVVVSTAGRKHHDQKQLG